MRASDWWVRSFSVSMVVTPRLFPRRPLATRTTSRMPESLSVEGIMRRVRPRRVGAGTCSARPGSGGWAKGPHARERAGRLRPSACAARRGDTLSVGAAQSHFFAKAPSTGPAPFRVRLKMPWPRRAAAVWKGQRAGYGRVGSEPGHARRDRKAGGGRTGLTHPNGPGGSDPRRGRRGRKAGGGRTGLTHANGPGGSDPRRARFGIHAARRFTRPPDPPSTARSGGWPCPPRRIPGTAGRRKSGTSGRENPGPLRGGGPCRRAAPAGCRRRGRKGAR